MKIPPITDEQLDEAIQRAEAQVADPQRLLERYGAQVLAKRPGALEQVIAASASQLVILLELRHRREQHGPLDWDGIDLVTVPRG